MPAPLQTGTLLLASHELKEGYFTRSVILIIHYNAEQGTMGLLLNRPINQSFEISINYNLQNIFTNDIEKYDLKKIFFEGGPVEQEYLFYLHRLGDVINDANPIVDDLYWGGTLGEGSQNTSKLDDDLLSIRFYLGYAGWEKGQLEEEINAGNWILSNCDTEKIFSLDNNLMWHDLLYAMGGNYRAMAKIPLDPNVN